MYTYTIDPVEQPSMNIMMAMLFNSSLRLAQAIPQGNKGASMRAYMQLEIHTTNFVLNPQKDSSSVLRNTRGNSTHIMVVVSRNFAATVPRPRPIVNIVQKIEERRAASSLLKSPSDSMAYVKINLPKECSLPQAKV